MTMLLAEKKVNENLMIINGFYRIKLQAHI